MLQSRAMNLHPVIVLVSVTVGGALFGLVGAFLAVPAAAMVAVVYRYLLEVLRINAGELGADDIEFTTDEGRVIAEIAEKDSVHKRQEWRGEREWVSAPVADEEADDHTEHTERFGTSSLRKLRDSGLERLRGWQSGDSSRDTPSEHMSEPER